MAVVFESRNGRMKGLTAFLSLNQERKDLGISKIGRIVLNQERKDLGISKIGRVVLNKERKDIGISKIGLVVLNQERKDIKICRILLIFISFLSWFKTIFPFLHRKACSNILH